MTQIGYTLSSEERRPGDLVREARMAEEAGFDFFSISDHFHPWIDRQGESPFAWTVIGAVAEATEKIPLITGVTCPTVRYHPAIIAQAAATTADLMPGRFSLGVGSGENLNEHILGDHWPSVPMRQDWLEESIDLIRKLWEGRITSWRGEHFTVENARIYTVPEEPPPILVASGGPEGTELAGRKGDGIVGLAPVPDLPQGFFEAGGEGKPAYGQIHGRWDTDREQAIDLALEVWPNTGVPGPLSQELPLPAHFEAAAGNVTREMIEEKVVCGPDPEAWAKEIRSFADAGYTHVFLHQIESADDAFFSFAREELLPLFSAGSNAG